MNFKSENIQTNLDYPLYIFDNLLSDKKNIYKLSFVLSKFDFLLLTLKSININPPLKYIKEFNIKEFKSNEYFLKYENMNDIVEELYFMINFQKNSVLLKEEKNKIILSIYFNKEKIIDINFNLEKEIKTPKQTTNEIFHYIKLIEKNVNINKKNDLKIFKNKIIQNLNRKLINKNENYEILKNKIIKYK